MGVIYIMWNFPYLWKVKIGVSTFGKTRKRVKSVNSTTPGWVFPIFVSVLPWGVPGLESTLHKLLKPLHSPFTKGSGKTEWFLILALIPAIFIITVETVIRWFLIGWPLLVLVWVSIGA